jgi:hypothetical protein
MGASLTVQVDVPTIRKEVIMNTHNDPEDVEYLAAIELVKRPVTEDQGRRFEGYAAEIFSAFGLDLHTPATKDIR